MKMRMKTGLMLAALSMIAAAHGQTACRSSRGFLKAVTVADVAWLRAANAKDFDAMAAVYSGDAKVMPPGHASVAGHGNIAAFWKAALKPVSKVQLRYSETHGMGAYAFRTGTFTMRGSKGGVLQAGKFVEVWHRGPAGWKLYRDIFNSNPSHAASASK